MKFVHIADLHFDAPFAVLSRNGLAESRRLEQRKVFKNIIEYIKNNKIELLFICGDLYEHEYVKQETIEFINQLFKEIKETKIFIVPGNHDPLLKNSYYNKFKWSENVHILNSEIERVSVDEKIDVYGYGFCDFYMAENKIKSIQLENLDNINILLTHASVDSGIQDNEMQYNPITQREIRDSAFDYVALGHIHKPLYNEKERNGYVYPGSTISLGFDELGEHGIIVGDIDVENKKITVEFKKMDIKEFRQEELNVSGIVTKEELIEKINGLSLEENGYYKLLLVGNRNFEINIYEINKYVQKQNIVKIKDMTRIKYDLEQLSKEQTLKGIFIRNMLEKIKKNEIEKDIAEEAIEVMLNALN